MFDPATIKRLQKDLTERVEKMKEDLKDEFVEGSAGGGAVTVVCNGNQEVSEVKIKAEAIDPDDPEMLQDLIMAAANQALEKSKELNESRVSEITGGLKLPGFF